MFLELYTYFLDMCLHSKTLSDADTNTFVALYFGVTEVFDETTSSVVDEHTYDDIQKQFPSLPSHRYFLFGDKW